MIIYRITVGYGDILPVNTDEMILCCLTMLIACGVFGYSLNVIGSIISDILAKDYEIDFNLEIINKFMRKKRVA